MYGRESDMGHHSDGSVDHDVFTNGEAGLTLSKRVAGTSQQTCTEVMGSGAHQMQGMHMVSQDAENSGRHEMSGLPMGEGGTQDSFHAAQQVIALGQGESSRRQDFFQGQESKSHMQSLVAGQDAGDALQQTLSNSQQGLHQGLSEAPRSSLNVSVVNQYHDREGGEESGVQGMVRPTDGQRSQIPVGFKQGCAQGQSAPVHMSAQRSDLVGHRRQAQESQQPVEPVGQNSNSSGQVQVYLPLRAGHAGAQGPSPAEMREASSPHMDAVLNPERGEGMQGRMPAVAKKFSEKEMNSSKAPRIVIEKDVPASASSGSKRVPSKWLQEKEKWFSSRLTPIQLIESKNLILQVSLPARLTTGLSSLSL